MGTRNYIQKHEETCPNIKVECSRCQTQVIRKSIYSHDCFTTLQQKLQKIDRTLVYVHSRIKNQEHAKKRFEYVLQMVKKKLMSHNKRAEGLLF